ncbi:hypothetical protein M438DRAFT_364440 [Aureobasidium pullulans EXF-150]|uniref:Uncharacterized protein n=1 Tax=Aureobasidium pullulans EXF-150 TaxID=1043002 RepID=A0A074XIJ2_AURPU|nr:uncharacterized protein M438DRAFT_364440 [Aureobasidium pullulans EXF-150]KEQ85330.1 hypothetical protein M438DRAFT_364440 [Aureobasidium pullulans EXF-150]
MITGTVEGMQISSSNRHEENITQKMDVIKHQAKLCRERILQATKELKKQLEKIIDEEVTRTVTDLNSNPTTKPLISIEPEPLKAFLAEKAKDRADAIFDDALMTEIRNRVKAQINKALMEDFEEFHRKQTEVLRQHLESDNAAADLDDAVIIVGGA